MKITIVSIFMILFVSCSDEGRTDKSDQMKTSKDIPTPKSDISTTNQYEVLAPQTCYYGCKARE
jgi:hypothetical protein